jgi:hypothetical protein
MIRHITLFILLLASSAGYTAETPSCASDAIARAKPLLSLHFYGEEERLSIADQAKELPSILNPANPKQRLRVYEVWGFIYKGQYRMRFIYHASAVTGCVLMGQEILQYARV